MKQSRAALTAIILFLALIAPLHALCADLNPFEAQVLAWANECAKEIEGRMENLLATGKLTEAQLFDTFYVPVPDTEPQKYHTQSDRFIDQISQSVLDAYLKKDKRLKFVVIVDVNGYLPTHNSRYTMPLTGNRDMDTKNNRTKRLFNDRTGIAAARNVMSFLLQHYSRDTGEMMSDLSVPIYVNNSHWGAIRFGFN